MAWLNLTMPNQTVKNGLKAKKIKLPQMNFFSQKTTNKIFMYLLAPFILKNFEKILRADPELWRCAFFMPKMAHLSWTKKFLYKRWLLLSTTYWPFSLCKILKKFLQQIQRYEYASLLGCKWIICPKQCFFLKKIIKIIFIYLLAPFILQNKKKILSPNPELWGCAIFGSKLPQFVLNKIFWYKPLLLLSSNCWPFSLGKI